MASRRSPPRVSGLALRTLASFAGTAAGGSALKAIFRKDLGLDQLEKLPASLRGPFPLGVAVVTGRAPRTPHDAVLDLPPTGAWPRSHVAFVSAFSANRASPIEITTRALEAARRFAGEEPSVGPMLVCDDAAALRDAAASEARYRKGAPLSVLDGVPLVVKEETAIAGLPSRLGTAFLSGQPVSADATVVARLRAAGAIVLGHTPMTEYGMSPIGLNGHRNMPRNPHASDRFAGGSSTGSGVAVAEGVAPLAVAADGGGSIRIPACINGVFGIKATWGRVSRHGDAFGGSMNHVGPIGASVGDLAAFLELAAGRDPLDPQTASAPDIPRGSLFAALGRGVRGLRIGVVETEWDEASPAVAAAGRAALALLEREGATLVPLRFEFGKYAAAVGYVCIGLESFAETFEDRALHLREMGPDLQIMWGALASLSASDLVDSMRLRAGLRDATAALLRDVDLLALPTTVRSASRVTDDEAKGGMIDSAVLGGLCRFAFLANLTGLPALTAPVGTDADGLPVGLQLMGDAYDEATVLGAAAHLERIGVARPLRPRASVDLLDGVA